MTSQLQVVDGVVNKESRLSTLYREWLVSGNCPFTPMGYIRRHEALFRQWIKTAWNGISPESVVRVLEKCCMATV